MECSKPKWIIFNGPANDAITQNEVRDWITRIFGSGRKDDTIEIHDFHEDVHYYEYDELRGMMDKHLKKLGEPGETEEERNGNYMERSSG